MLSVVIATQTVNARCCRRSALVAGGRRRRARVIVADGASRDASATIAEGAGCRVVTRAERAAPGQGGGRHRPPWPCSAARHAPDATWIDEVRASSRPSCAAVPAPRRCIPRRLGDIPSDPDRGDSTVAAALGARQIRARAS